MFLGRMHRFNARNVGQPAAYPFLKICVRLWHLWLSSAPRNLRCNRLEDRLLVAPDKEVVAREYLQVKGAFSVDPPRSQFIFGGGRIEAAAIHANRAFERCLGLIDICLERRNVCSQRWKEELHQFAILQDERRHSVKALGQLGQKHLVR
jgi:hypothetical protein